MLFKVTAFCGKNEFNELPYRVTFLTSADSREQASKHVWDEHRPVLSTCYRMDVDLLHSFTYTLED